MDKERTDRYTGQRFAPAVKGAQLKVPGWEDVNIAALARAMRRPYNAVRYMLCGRLRFVRWDDLRKMSDLLEMPLVTICERVDYSQRLRRLDAVRVSIREQLFRDVDMIEKARFADWEAIKKLITPEAAAIIAEDIREGRIKE